MCAVQPRGWNFRVLPRGAMGRLVRATVVARSGAVLEMGDVRGVSGCGARR